MKSKNTRVKIKAIIGAILFVSTLIITKIEIFYRFIPNHSYFGAFIIMLNVIISIYLGKDYVYEMFKYSSKGKRDF